MYLTIFDIETDGYLEEVSLIHCMSYKIYKNNVEIHRGSLTDYKSISNFILTQECLIGHNIVLYDIPVLEKILGIKVKCKLIDTLGLSWYLFPTETTEDGTIKTRRLHGLEAWGEVLGVKKPEITDWKNLSLEEYIHRCEEDVEINSRLFLKMQERLKEIYEGEDYWRIIGYITFKLECLREQQEEKCFIDKEMCQTHLNSVMELIEEKTQQLSDVMPPKDILKVINKPKVMFKKDGSLSANGEKWTSKCEEFGYDPETTESFKYKVGEEEANPGSSDQIKDWLLSLGWQPTMTEQVVSKTTGNVSTVHKVTKGGKLCDDIYRLAKQYPELEALKGLTMLKHRKGVFEGFIKASENTNTVVAGAQGFTNTMRFKHVKPIANLTKVNKPWGKEIRSVITVESDDELLCGADMSALEDTTKQHYMYYFDPDYVMQMRVPGFDPHLDIAVTAGLMTEEQAESYKRYSKMDEDGEDFTDEEHKEYLELSSIRANAKTVNFGAVYGAGPPKLSETLKCEIGFAQALHSVYWERNKAVKLVAKNTYVKTLSDGTMWLYNPVSGFYYSLREEKDIFSTLNQSTGVYCFDSWIRKVRSKGIKLFLQYHDEKGSRLKATDKEEVTSKLRSSVDELNEELKLNVPLGISVKFGKDYSSIH